MRWTLLAVNGAPGAPPTPRLFFSVAAGPDLFYVLGGTSDTKASPGRRALLRPGGATLMLSSISRDGTGGLLLELSIAQRVDSICGGHGGSENAALDLEDGHISTS